MDHFEVLKENIKQASVLSSEDRKKKLKSLYDEEVEKILSCFSNDDLRTLQSITVNNAKKEYLRRRTREAILSGGSDLEI